MTLYNLIYDLIICVRDRDSLPLQLVLFRKWLFVRDQILSIQGYLSGNGWSLVVINIKWLVVIELKELQDKVKELTKFKYEVEMCDEGYISQPVLRSDTCCYN